jgi:NAD(P)-dependent dehydrogenase (short-subunit alcohol dehydrogenase family)
MSASPLLVLITGANAGLGYHTVHHLATMGGFHVLVGARTIAKAEGAIRQILVEVPQADASLLEPLVIDLTSDTKIAAAAVHVANKHGKLDILVNNAAISGADSSLDSLRARYNAVFDTNVTGTAVVTDTFISLLQKSTAPTRRIVMVSSTLGSLNLTHGGQAPKQERYVQYSVSKAALNMLTLYTMDRVNKDGIAVITMSPGYCATNLNNFSGILPPEEGALVIVDSITKGNFENMNGKFIGSRKGKEESYPW